LALERRVILVLNVGSSTLKYALFEGRDNTSQIARGSIEHEKAGDCDSTLHGLLDDLEKESQLTRVSAIGHRVVHGGQRFRESVVIGSEVRRGLTELVSLAPDHLPLELRAIDTISRRLPQVVQIACFDTAFHRQMPTRARLFGVPRKLADAGVVRYGFHGLSCEYIVRTLRNAGELPRRTIIAHLGNGASLTALLDGVSIDTTMGMTPTGGLVMSKRSGDLDPGALLFMLRALGFSASDVESAVDKEGGLLGLSEHSSDVRALLAARATNTKASDALDVFTYQAKKYIGAYAAALGGLDLLVFTGGVGEHSPEMRGEICDDLDFLGIRVELSRNHINAETISSDRSGVRVLVMPTNEEAVIASHVNRLVGDQIRTA